MHSSLISTGWQPITNVGDDCDKLPLLQVINVFCPTGEGGGVDPTCTPGRGPKGTPIRKVTPIVGYHTTQIENLTSIGATGLKPFISTTGGGTGGYTKSDRGIYLLDKLRPSTDQDAPETLHPAVIVLRVKILPGIKAFDDTEVREYASLPENPNSSIGIDSAFVVREPHPAERLQVLTFKDGKRKWIPIKAFIKSKEFQILKKKYSHGDDYDTEVTNLLEVINRTGQLRPSLIQVINRWDESKHPRDERGRFGQKGASTTTTAGETLYQVSRDSNKVWRDAGGVAAPEHVQHLAIPPAWRDVYVNPNPDGDLMARGIDTKGRIQSRYSATHNSEAAAAKFGRVSELISKRTMILQEVNRDIRNPELREEAECLKLIIHTGIRPGSDRDTGTDYEAYGATTLLGKHVRTERDGSVTLVFPPGKHQGRPVEFRISDPSLIDMLIRRKQNAGREGRLFDTDSDALIDYSLSKDGGGFKVKDHRTALGTTIAIDTIKTLPTPRTEKEYKRLVNEVGDIVSEKLGNTRSVALKSYIDPNVFLVWKPVGMNLSNNSIRLLEVINVFCPNGEGGGIDPSCSLNPTNKPKDISFPKHSSWKELEKDPEYIYHATNLDNARFIARSSLITHGPSYGTDQEDWPDGSRERRSYFATSPSSAYYFAPGDGKPVLLRVKKTASRFKRETTGDYYSTKAISHKHLEILTDDGWKPLKSIRHDGFGANIHPYE